MKNKKTRRIVIGLIILIIAVVLIRQYINKNKSKHQETTSSASGNSSGSSANSITSECTNTTVLKKGSRCDRVKWAQYEINKVRSLLGISKLTEDGIFGTNTENAFQKLLYKKTGTYAEVFRKVNDIATFGVYGSNSNDSIGWHYADGTPVY